MAIALRGSAVVPAGNPTTGFTLAVDAAVVAGDLLFLALTSRDSTGAGSLGVSDNDAGGNAWSKIANSTDHKGTLWYKRATAGTAGKTVTVAGAVGSSAGVLKAFSGGDAGATPYSNVAVETNASGDESHAGFVPGQADSMVCCSVHNHANDNAVTSLSFATLGATTATEKLSTGGSDCGCAFGHVLQGGAAAATGNLTWAQTNGATYSITWAIKPAAVFTATAAPSSGAATVSGSATFAPGTKTATGALATGAATASGSGAFATAQEHSATGSPSAGAAVASGSATFAPGTKTASAAVSAGAVTAGGEAAFSPGTKTAAGALSAGAAVGAGSAAFSAGTKTASAALSAGAATLGGSAQFASDMASATGALLCGATTASGAAGFEEPVPAQDVVVPGDPAWNSPRPVRRFTGRLGGMDQFNFRSV